MTSKIGAIVAAEHRLQITASNKALAAGWTWVPELAPSKDLFRKYIEWRNCGQWPAKWPDYERQFLNEAARSSSFWRWITNIQERISEGQTVAISCFCPNERYCHRRLVKDLVLKEKEGHDVG
jgi:uncharacterized protein YeaO (DUF488 family)